jgi:hypothetical protein
VQKQSFPTSTLLVDLLSSKDFINQNESMGPALFAKETFLLLLFLGQKIFASTND